MQAKHLGAAKVPCRVQTMFFPLIPTNLQLVVACDTIAGHWYFLIAMEIHIKNSYMSTLYNNIIVIFTLINLMDFPKTF